MVELDREARVGPVAGAVLIFRPVRCPLPGEAVGGVLMAEFEGLSRVVVAARSAAAGEPPRERGVWAEAVAMLVARAARMRSFFIRQGS